ncbi:MAG TPA: VOC family protein [Patescibacteria group bacterium]|jgi:predicted 3-demethylubiquinone-9 3-methyltransferase (glyoxalase superfamily)
MSKQKITPCLWFDNQAEEAVNSYVSIFKDSKIGKTARYDEASAKVSGRPAGSVLTVEFQIAGQQFLALNGGPLFKFSEAVSFVVDCKDQEEVDYYWDKLIADGGAESQCGWLKDRFGLSWQIVPERLGELLSDPDPGTSQRAMQAMLKMQKIDVAELEKAVQGG